MLTLAQLDWRYEDGQALALHNINLQLYPGEVVGVVGLSGAGKTTLLLALAGLIPANYAGQFSGQRQVSGETGIVFQDPETQFIGLTVEEEIAFSLENRGYSDEEMERRIDHVLRMVRLDGFAGRSPYELSGGEKQRVAIASALAAGPQILILDEPTSELDPIGAREVFSLLRRLKQEENMTIVISSHATEELAQFCDRMLLVSSGRVMHDLPVAQFFAQAEELAAHGFFVPEMIQLYRWLENARLLPPDVNEIPLTVELMLPLYEKLARSKAGVGK